MKVNGNIQFEIVEQSAEKVVGRMPVQAGILNPFGTVHAGATLWFADVCATVLSFGGGILPSAALGPSVAVGGGEAQAGQTGFPLAINLNANLLGNQRDGSFTATSVYVKKGKRLSVVRTTVTGDNGRVIADVTTSHVPAQ